jgi:hypothetical protein
MAKAELQPDRVIKRPSLGMGPPLGFVDSGLAYTGTEIEVGDWCPEEDEDFDEGDADHDPFEFDVDSDFGSDYISVRSESSTPTSYYVAVAFDWPSPYRGKIADGEGYPHANTFTLLGSPLQGSFPFRLSVPIHPPLTHSISGQPNRRTPSHGRLSQIRSLARQSQLPPYNPLSHWSPHIMPWTIPSPKLGRIGSLLRWRRGYGSLQGPLQSRLSIRLREMRKDGTIGSI